MGANLSIPVLSKFVENYSLKYSNMFEDKSMIGNIDINTCTFNGKRSEYEDEYIIFMAHHWIFIGVFDGHGGDACVSNVKKMFLNQLNCWKDRKMIYDSQIVEACIEIDAILTKNKYLERSGSTATFCFIYLREYIDKYLIQICNIGDSRIVAMQNDLHIFSTVDHTPKLHAEQKRIKIAGGCVTNDRINGRLAVSRAFGDGMYKQNSECSVEKQMVIPMPTITGIVLNTNSKLIISCDGVYENNRLNSESVVKLANKGSCAIVDCAFNLGSCDNITCIVVSLNLIATNSYEPKYDLISNSKLIPGPFLSNSDLKFVEAYANFSIHHGLSLGATLHHRYVYIIYMISHPSVMALLSDMDQKNIKVEMNALKMQEAIDMSVKDRIEWYDRFVFKL